MPQRRSFLRSFLVVIWLFKVAPCVAEFKLSSDSKRCDEKVSSNLQLHVEDRYTQPVVPIRIETQFIVMSLNDIVDVTGTVSLTARLDFRWLDSRLAVKNEPNCTNETALVKTTDLWVNLDNSNFQVSKSFRRGNFQFPYFIVQNGANFIFYPDAWEKFPISLRGDGGVEWRVAFKFDLNCDMDFTIFPFDTQYCKALIQSPHYGDSELIYNVSDPLKAVVLFNADDSDNPMWTFSGQFVTIKTKVPGIAFYFSIKRKFIYYVWTVLIPILGVTVMTASSFIVPAEGDEKMSTAISGLLSFFLLYLIFVNAIPADSSKLPLLMILYSILIILTASAVLLCSLVLRTLHKQSSNEKGESNRPGSHTKVSLLYNARGRNKITPFKPDSEARAHSSSKKEKLVTPKFLNDLSLFGYLIAVALAFFVFTVYTYSLYAKAISKDKSYTSIQVYELAE